MRLCSAARFWPVRPCASAKFAVIPTFGCARAIKIVRRTAGKSVIQRTIRLGVFEMLRNLNLRGSSNDQ